MKHLGLMKGRNVYDFFIIPTIRISTMGLSIEITIEWLKWYIGITW